MSLPMPAQFTQPRSVVHLNVVDFAASVERVVERRLAGRPLIVAHPGAPRARVLDMSEEAFQAGIRKRMPLEQARKVCREAKVLPPRPDLYQRAMTALFRLGGRYSPLVESGQDDGHLFLDLTGTRRLWGPAQDAAWRLRKEARDSFRLDPIWSVAPNKLVAKAASRIVKPDGELIVNHGDEESLLRPLPIHLLPGLEQPDLTLFRELNITRVGQAAEWTPVQLEAVFGRRGLDLNRWVRGIDDSPVLPPGKRPPRIEMDHEFADDTNQSEEVEAALYRLVELAGARLRLKHQAARRTAVCLDYSDGVRIIRQRTDRIGTAIDRSLFALAKEALYLAWLRRVRIRKLKLICDLLVPPPRQLELFPEEDSQTRKANSLQAALDKIRDSYGTSAIRTGRSLAA